MWYKRDRSILFHWIVVFYFTTWFLCLCFQKDFFRPFVIEPCLEQIFVLVDIHVSKFYEHSFYLYFLSVCVWFIFFFYRCDMTLMPEWKMIKDGLSSKLASSNSSTASFGSKKRKRKEPPGSNQMVLFLAVWPYPMPERQFWLPA